jgi:hypothetical protein
MSLFGRMGLLAGLFLFVRGEFHGDIQDFPEAGN